VKSRRIIGYAKTGANAPGAEKSKHVWNAVQVDGQWALIDSMWAAGKIKKSQVKIRMYLGH